MIIYLAESQEISPSAIDLLIENGHKVIVNLSSEEYQKVDVLFIRTYVRADEKYLSKFPNLKFIIRAGVGTDNIDLEECAKRGIKVINSPGANALSVAEYSLSMMLTLLKQISYHKHNLTQGIWRDRAYLGNELSGKTVGLAGCGAVGRELAKLLSVFNVKIIGYDKYMDSDKFKKLGIKQVSLSELLTDSDLISVQIPLTAETADMFTLREFQQMKSTCFFINVSRGELIKEEDLLKALTLHIIAGAALDVTRNEPNVNPRLVALNNLIITPHIASFTREADENIAVSAVNNFLKILEGKI